MSFATQWSRRYLQRARNGSNKLLCGDKGVKTGRETGSAEVEYSGEDRYEQGAG